MDLGEREPPVLGPPRAGRGAFQKLAQRLLANLLLRDAAGRAVVLQDHAVPREGRDVVPRAAVLHVMGLGVLDAQPETALVLLQLQPASLRERQPFALGAGAVRDDEARELAAVGRRPLGVDPQAGDLRTEDARLDPLGEREAREAELHRVEEVIRPRDDAEHQRERRGPDRDGEECDRPVEGQQIDARGAEGSQLGVGRQPADSDQEPEEKRDRAA